MDGAAWKIIDGVGYSKKSKYIHTQKKNNCVWWESDTDYILEF